MLARFGWHIHEVANKFQRLAFGPEFRYRAFALVGVGEEPLNRRAKFLCDEPQFAGRNPVHATFIFLQLLKSETNPVGEHGLAESTHDTAHANPLTDMDIDGMSAEFLNGASFSSGHNTSAISSWISLSYLFYRVSECKKP